MSADDQAPGGGSHSGAALPAGGLKVLVGLTGSVATIKAGELVEALQRSGCQVQCVATAAATHFLKDQWALGPSVKVLLDKDEWDSYKVLGDPVLHIDLRNWADVLVIAPLDANTMGKLANGLCDNLLTCIARAWDFGKPFVVAPAMNTFMWNHPATAKHLRELGSLGIITVLPIEKKLACGDVGIGAMERPATIVRQLLLLAANYASAKTLDS
ncbi:MAG: flavoprotein [archaeon]|nr:flavoprotein [archaeon]